MTRAQTILAVVLAFQIALIAGFRAMRAHEMRESAPRKLVPALATVEPAKLVIDGQNGKTLTLLREGKVWSVPAADGWPADSSRITDLVSKLKTLEVQAPIATGKRVWESLGVSDGKFVARLKIFASPKDEKPAAEVFFGSSATAGMANVRASGSDAVYETKGISPYDLRTDTSNWISKSLVDVSADRIVGLRIANASGTFELRKDADTWKVALPADRADATVAPAKVDQLVLSAATISVADPAGKLDPSAQGFDSPAATITILIRPPAAQAKESPAPAPTIIRVGKFVEESTTQRYVAKDGFPFAGKIWSGSVDRFVDAKIDDLVAR